MAGQKRAHFSSRLGFILAAAGSAVGLGNIWGFPTQAAENGGAAFLLIYLLMVLVLAYPLLIAELTIGRYTQANPVAATRQLWNEKPKLFNRLPNKGAILGITALVMCSGVLSFYVIVSGWLVSYFLEPIALFFGAHNLAQWMVSGGDSRSILFTVVFMLINILVVKRGVSGGIEKLSVRLMPIFCLILIGMVIYVLTLPGAQLGLIMYLKPDFTQISPELVVEAMGQAFFSLSLGVCSMVVYGSYLKKDINIPKTAGQVAIVDSTVAFVAGLLIIPAMFVAQHNGVEIFNSKDVLLDSGTLVFSVLPALFESMGTLIGPIVALCFFLLMAIAALTSSISLLEVPVVTTIEESQMSRSKASWLIGGVVTLFSICIITNTEWLFGLVVNITTVYAQPILSVCFALFIGWVMNRSKVYREIAQGNPEFEQSLLGRIWPLYVSIVCPILLLLVFIFQLSNGSR